MPNGKLSEALSVEELTDSFKKIVINENYEDKWKTNKLNLFLNKNRVNNVKWSFTQ